MFVDYLVEPKIIIFKLIYKQEKHLVTFAFFTTDKLVLHFQELPV